MLNKTEVYITTQGYLERDLKRAVAWEIHAMDSEQFTFTTALHITELLINDETWNDLEAMRNKLKNG